MSFEMVSICPACVIVSGTWLVLSGAVAFDFLPADTWILPVAILMGGTVVGLAWQAEKTYEWSQRHPIFNKVLFFLPGFPAVYVFAANLNRTLFALEVVLMLLFGYLFFVKRGPSPGQNPQTAKLEEKLKKCC